ncbi:MAG: discoidin domain-containing protein [Eubacterium sp.]|nr:discoidin domain-containing protein [Eubacterium sp.]
MRKHVKMLKSSMAVVLSAAMVMGSLQVQQTEVKAVDRSVPWLLSTDRPAYASSANGGDIASFATDGRLGTQWGAAANKADQWLDVDLGGKADISKVVIDWQNDASYGVAYKVLVSDDEINWTTAYETTTGTGGDVKNVLRSDGSVDYSYYEDVLSTDAAENYRLTQKNGRYVRVLINYSKSQAYSDDKKSGWGASIREIQVYGIGDNNCVQPVSPAQNIALGKNVSVSSYSQPWWAANPLAGSNAVDNDYESYWLSESQDKVADACNQNLTVDLGAKHTIGRVKVQWQTEYGNIWDLQVSEDGEHFTTVYRQLEGNGEDEDIEIYAQNVRYVRVQGILMGRGSGYSIREIQVYDYQNGDDMVTYQIPNIPEQTIVNKGKGSYVIDDANLLQPREPKYVTSNVTKAIPSNDWWTSIIYTKYSDTMPALPMAYSYSKTGLGMYYADGFYSRTENGGMGADSKYKDITVGASNITGKTSAKLDSYGDWSVNVAFSDNDTPKMLSTLVKGSPFVYNTFTDRNAVELNVNNIVKFFDKNGNEILEDENGQVTIDHFAVETENESEAPGDGNKKQYHYYGVYMPENTKVYRVGNKLKIQLGSNQNYLVIGALCVDEPIALLSTETVSNAASKNDAQAREQLEFMFKHAYSYVTNTVADYSYNESTATCTTTYQATVDQKRTGNGIENSTIMCMMPHQWKYSNDSYVSGKNYSSVRGDLRIHEGNQFSFSQRFNGVIPQYTTPEESDSYNTEWMYAYLEQFTDSALKSYWVADPYWQGKKSHPIAMGILIADQLGEYETRDKLISVLRKIMENWLTYDGPEDYPYYMYYHTSWGAISGDGGDHGMAINLSDHHFLWAYFIFPAAVLGSYDQQFVEDYGDMIEVLIRDCMNPNKNDDKLPYMRNFDVYESHSWAGGYGDNNSGNNQESASEATFAWAGLYLWGLVTKNNTYRDAGIWGYTSEIDAIEQYWFNMDQGTNLDSHNWAPGYGVDVYGDANCDVLPYTGMVWGLGYTNGTYFSGNPCCIMGIHLLPVTPAITYMGYRKNTVTRIWNEYEQVEAAYQAKMVREEATDPEGWFHILWPFMALSDANGAANRWANEYTSHINAEGNYVDGVLSTDEMFNSYWYIQNMCAKGDICTSIWASDYTSFQVFEKTVNGAKKYTAEVWNPFDEDITVHFKNANGNLGSVKVPAHMTVDCDPTKNEDKTVKNGKKVEAEPVHNYDPVCEVPGVLEAEDYYTNFSCEPDKNEQEGGYVGWIDDGDALLYTVNVAEEADYVVDYRVQCTDQNKNSAIRIKTENDADYQLTTVLGNETNEWKNVKANGTIHLKKGTYKLKLLFVDGGFNINYTKIYKSGTKPPVAASDDLTKEDLSDYPEIDLSNAEVIDVSSESNSDGAASHIIDKNYATRWESEAADPQYFTIDLKEEKEIGGIKLYWEGAASKKYTIQTSKDKQNWTTVFTQNLGKGGQGFGDDKRDNGLESIAFSNVTTARYVRLYSTERLTGYGVSLFEVRLFGSDGNSGTPNPGNPDPGNPDPGEPTLPSGNVAKDKQAFASSQEGANVAATNAVDGVDETRWSSLFTDDEWIYVDLENSYNVNKVVLKWEAAYGKDYDIYVSDNAQNWTKVKEVRNSNGGTDEEEFTATAARYVKIQGVHRATGYGYSLWEMEVYTGKGNESGGGDIPEGTNVALGGVTDQSASEGASTNAMYAVDGDEGTRWSSNFDDNAWMSVDLGEEYSINRVIIKWENAYGKDYKIMTSTDGEHWTTAKNLTNQNGGTDDFTFDTVNARYVKMQGVTRGTGYGYSIWEFQVLTAGQNQTQPGGGTVPSETNVALNAEANQSGSEGAGVNANYAVDGNEGTRWASNYDDDAWMTLDFGQAYTINKIKIQWEAAYGKDYDILVSTDGQNWTTVKELRNQDGGLDEFTFQEQTVRYMKLQGVSRGTGYGYSIWEMQVLTK